MKKRILIFILTVAITLGIFPLTVSAQTTFKATENWYEIQTNDGTPNELDINSENDFLAFSESILDNSKTYDGQVVHIRVDLNFKRDDTYYSWRSAIGSEKEFKGIIDGHGHTINGLDYENTDSGAGNYNGLLGGKIVSGSEVNGSYGVGAGIFNLAIVDCKMNVSTNYTGALFGAVMNSEKAIAFENVYVDVDIESSGNYIGGLVGYNNAQTSFKDCVFVGTLGSGNGSSGIGGFMGANGIHKGVPASVNITASAFYGNFSLDASSTKYGALIGIIGRDDDEKPCIATTELRNVVVGGTSSIGAIVGYCDEGSSLTCSSVKSAIAHVGWCGGGSGTYPQMGYVDVLGTTFQEMIANVPTGFVAVPWGYAMPRGVVNFSREHVERSAASGATTAYVGFQTTDFVDGYCELRLIAITSDGKEGQSLDGFSSVGFEVEMTAVLNGNTKTWRNTDGGEDPETKKVFSSVMGKSNDDKTTKYTAEALGGDYVFVATVEGMKQNKGVLTFTVRTFHDDEGGARVYDDVYVISYDTGVSA